MTTDRERDSYRAEMLARLDHIDERDREAAAMSDQSVALLLDIVDRQKSAMERFAFASQAFPGMTWGEFTLIDVRRQRAGKRGRKPAGLEARAETAIARAARDVDRLVADWRSRGQANDPPIDPCDIAGQRHGVDPVEVAERVRRPKSRNPHRLTSDS